MNHIRSANDDTESLCGDKTESFKTLDQAYMNGRYDGTVLICHQCTEIAIQCLRKGSTIDDAVIDETVSMD